MPSVPRKLAVEVDRFIQSHRDTAELVADTFRQTEQRIDALRVPSSIRRWHAYKKDPDTELPLRDMGPLVRHLGLMETVVTQKSALSLYDTRALDMTQMRMQGMLTRLEDIAATSPLPPQTGKSPFAGDGSLQKQAAVAAAALEAMLEDLKDSRLIEKLMKINFQRDPELHARLLEHPPTKDGSWVKRVSGEPGWKRER